MKKCVLLFSMILSCSLIFAQGKFEEVVYLKNGSIIHGMIVEFVPNTSIKIKSGDNLFAYKFDEIEKITREVSTVAKNGYGYKPKGYVGIVEAGLTDFPGSSNTSLAMATVTVINGYQFSPYIFLGGGVGADISSVNVYNVPVFADFRAYFTKTRVAPFFEAAFGYNLQINATPASNYYYYSQPSSINVYHGMMANPSFGVRVAINKKFATSLTLGYKLLGVNQTVTDYYYGGTSSQFVLSHGITVKAGFHF